MRSVCGEDLRSPALLQKNWSLCEAGWEGCLVAGSWSESQTWCRTHPTARSESRPLRACCHVQLSGDLEKKCELLWIVNRMKHITYQLTTCFNFRSSHLARLYSSDDSRVDKGFGPFGGVFDERLPLPRQPDKLLLLLIKVCMYAMLKVGRSGDLDTRLLLFGEHDGGCGSCSLASDLQGGRRKETRVRKD